MKKRFFFYRVIRANRAWVSVNDRAQNAIDIDSHPAVAALAGLNNTHLWT